MITFITNSKKLGSKNLKDRLQEVIEITTELKILVGYFYFSGINELYETLRKLYKENKLSQEHIKILVGMFDSKDKNIESKDRFIRDLICSIQRHLIYSAETVFNRIQQGSNEYDIIDMIDIKEKQIEFFIELLKKKIVVIKKTVQDNHSKLYLFKTNKTSAPHLLITGSSNLTNLGLTGRSEHGYGDILQDEFNIEIEGYELKEVEKYFNNLWKNAIPLLEDDINEIKKIVLPPKESITKECCIIKVYEDSCFEMFEDKKNGNLKDKGKNYYTSKIEEYYPCENNSSKPTEKSIQQPNRISF